MWYLVKGLSEIHDDHISLLMTPILSTIQVAYHVMVELDQLGFARPLTSETINADSQQECFQRLSACLCCLLLYALGFCNRVNSAQNHFGPSHLGQYRFFHWETSARDAWAIIKMFYLWDIIMIMESKYISAEFCL